MSMYTIWTHT